MNEHVKYGNPVIEGKVLENASVNHDAFIGPSATVRENAYVTAYARVEDWALIQGNAKIHGAAVIKGDAVVNGNAHVGGSVSVGDNAHIGGEANLGGEFYVGGFADINSNDDYVVIHGLAPRTLTIYKSSVWGVEVALGYSTSSLEDFLKFGQLPGNVKKIIELTAQKWK
jgi:carbonic anhydrase/acetyltransferase-like protein (isoleucine patch superfamily)